MDSAVERIVQAIRQREKIVVFGDYDVDGVLQHGRNARLSGRR